VIVTDERLISINNGLGLDGTLQTKVVRPGEVGQTADRFARGEWNILVEQKNTAQPWQAVYGYMNRVWD